MKKKKQKLNIQFHSLRAFPLIRHNTVKLKGFENAYRIRVGRLRIIFRFFEKERLILIEDIVPRKKAYR